MRLAQNQADWYKDTFDALVENVAGVVLGKESVIELHSHDHARRRPPAARGCAGNRKDTAGQVDGRGFCQGTHSRIQFTPDLLPSDVTGITVYDQQRQEFEFPQGADLLIDRAGRRDQPCQPQDAVGAAGGDGVPTVESAATGLGAARGRGCVVGSAAGDAVPGVSTTACP